MRIKVRSPSNFSWVIARSRLAVLKLVRQADSSDRQQQSRDHARANVSCRPPPFAFCQHLRGFPSETGKRGVAAKKSHCDGHAHIGGDQHPVQHQLPNQSEQETAGEIDQQSSIGKSAAHTQLHHALQSVTRERTDGSEQRNQEYFQARTSPPVFANQHKAKAARCACGMRLKMESVANLSTDLPRIVPMRSAEGVGIVQKVAAVRNVLRCEADRESLANGL